MILNGYELCLKEYSDDRQLEILKARNSEEALTLLEEHNEHPFQIVFLDINLPISEELNLINGEELGVKITKKCNAKIVVITSIVDQDRIYGILKNINPHGFITKNEATPEMLIEAIDSTLKNEKFYSKEVKNYNQNIDPKEPQSPYLDTIDLQILQLISVGEKVKNLPDFVPLSLPSIERRKKKIKVYLGVSSTSDRELILKARDKGFL